LDNNRDIEKLFKDQFENFEVEPGTDVWSKIKSEISPNAKVNPDATSVGTKVVSISSSWMSTIIIGAIITSTIAGSYLFFEKKTEAKKMEAKSSQNETTDDSVSKLIEIPEDKTKEGEVTFSNNVEEKNLIEEKLSNKSVSKKSSLNKEKASPTTEPIASQNEEEVEEFPSDTEEKESIENPIITENDETTSISKENSTSNNSKNVIESSNSQEKSALNKNNVSSDNSISADSDIIEENKSEEEVIIEQLNSYPLPNVFTPNQDGKNDFFEINIQEASIDAIEVAIFDRTGNLIKQWNNPFDKWDGNLTDGTAAPKGLYLYQIILKKENIQVLRKGVITLNR
jgi:gliding motility-associated-like protein